MGQLARVETDQRGSRCVIRIDGEIDLSNVSEISAIVGEAVPAKATTVVVDLSRTVYLDSAGIQMLIELDRRVRSGRRELRLVVPPDSMVRPVLELTALSKFIPTDPALDG